MAFSSYTIYTTELVTEALNFARKAHAKQTYTSGYDYFDAHIIKVVNQLSKNGESNLGRIIGALHDVYEDTGVTRDEILEHFGGAVDEAVWCLTREKDKESYFDYIRRVKQNNICKKVKTEDVGCNYKASIASGDKSKQSRYAKALLILLGWD